MIGDQYSDPPFSQVENHVLQIVNCQWIDACEWFIQQYILRFCSQRARNFGPPSFTSRQGVATRVADVLDAKLLQQLLNPFELLAPAQSHSLQHRKNVL